MFGVGNAFDSVVSLCAYIFMRKRMRNAYEAEFVRKINDLIRPLDRRLNEILNLIGEYKTTCVKCLFEFKCTLKILEYDLKETCEEAKNLLPIGDNLAVLPAREGKSLKNIFKKIGNTVNVAINNLFLTKEKVNYKKIQKILGTEDEELINIALDYWNLLDQTEKVSFKDDRELFWIWNENKDFLNQNSDGNKYQQFINVISEIRNGLSLVD